MRKLALFLGTALLAFGADDPWAKLKELKTGAELRIHKKGAAHPLLVKMDELTGDNLVVIDKTRRPPSRATRSIASITGPPGNRA